MGKDVSLTVAFGSAVWSLFVLMVLFGIIHPSLPQLLKSVFLRYSLSPLAPCFLEAAPDTEMLSLLERVKRHQQQQQQKCHPINKMSVSFSASAGKRKHITPRSIALIGKQTIHLMPKMAGGGGSRFYKLGRRVCVFFSRSTSGRLI